MITAIVFVKADVARIPEVAEQIADLAGVSEVYSVTGQIDLIAMVRVRDHDDVAAVVADQLNKVPGVTSTETHIAFRAYSRHDLRVPPGPLLGLDQPLPDPAHWRDTAAVHALQPFRGSRARRRRPQSHPA